MTLEDSQRSSESDYLIDTSNLQLNRKLTSRHIQMIAIGGTIGTGLFLGSGATIAKAGPLGALIGYSIVGSMVYSIMTSLGELATHYPISGSFSTYAGKYVDPALGFALGWNYWFQWAISFPSELSAAGLIVDFWFPNFPKYFTPLAILLFLVSIHLFGVERFGETEYWLSLIKVVAIVLFIAAGFAVDFGLLGNSPIYLKNWVIEGAPFKNGINGVFNVFLMAFFSFGGTEVIGITAGETLDPKTTIPKAIKNTFWRIFLFYILSVLTMGLVIRNDDPLLLNSGENGDVTRSPFTLVFERAGLSIAAHLMNGVVFSAVISAGNSALFAASRTLMALAEERKAPRIFCKLNRYGVPYYSLLASALVGCVSFVGIFLGDGTVFLWLISITGVSGILTWVSIALIHVRFRQGLKKQNIDTKTLSYIAPFYPFGPIVAFVLGVIIIFGQGVAAYYHDYGVIKIVISYIGIPLYIGLYLSYKTIYGTSLVPLEGINYEN